jgi:phosphohistidine phosphatase
MVVKRSILRAGETRQDRLIGVQVYIVRHAEAEPSGPEGDGGRALTARGQAQAAGAASGLRSLEVRLDRVLASPLRRAQETAAILARALGGPAIDTVAALDGGAPPEAIVAELTALGGDERVALVGHMPVLGELVALAAAGVAAGGVALGTASVARIDFEGRPRAGAGRLRWLLSAEQLARQAEVPPAADPED